MAFFELSDACCCSLLFSRVCTFIGTVFLIVKSQKWSSAVSTCFEIPRASDQNTKNFRLIRQNSFFIVPAQIAVSKSYFCHIAVGIQWKTSIIRIITGTLLLHRHKDQSLFFIRQFSPYQSLHLLSQDPALQIFSYGRTYDCCMPAEM